MAGFICKFFHLHQSPESDAKLLKNRFVMLSISIVAQSPGKKVEIFRMKVLKLLCNSVSS